MMEADLDYWLNFDNRGDMAFPKKDNDALTESFKIFATSPGLLDQEYVENRSGGFFLDGMVIGLAPSREIRSIETGELEGRANGDISWEEYLRPIIGCP